MSLDPAILDQLGIPAWQRQGLSAKLAQTLQQVESTPHETLETPAHHHQAWQSSVAKSAPLSEKSVVWLLPDALSPNESAFVQAIGQALDWQSWRPLLVDDFAEEALTEEILAYPASHLLVSVDLHEDLHLELAATLQLIVLPNPQALMQSPQAKKDFYLSWLQSLAG